MGVITILACIAAFLYLVSILWNRKKIQLPSPKGLPVFGNALQLNTKPNHLLFTEWAVEHGPIYKLRVFNHNIVVLSDYDHIYEALVSKGKPCGGRPFQTGKRVRYIWEYGNSVFINNPGPQWKFLRNTLHTNVKMYDKGLKKVESVNLSLITDLVQKVKAKGPQPFNPWDNVLNCIMNIICVFLVGRTFETNDEVFKLFKTVERETSSCLHLCSNGTELEIMWWLRHFGNKNFKRIHNLRETRRKLWAAVKQDIDQRRKEQAAGDEMTNFGIVGVMMSALEEARKNNTILPGNVTEKNIMLTFQELIFAGSTTTSNSFYAFLKIIIHYQDVQEKLREEVDAVVGGNRQVSLCDKPNMPYTRATILELLRFTSIVPLGVAHSTQQDVTIQGHFIPKDTHIITNLWAMHHDPHFWKDSFVFRPDRFLDEHGELLPPDHVNRKHLMPFSAGTRVCLGESFALGRLFLLLATMAQMFEMKPGTVIGNCDSRLFTPGTTLSASDFEMSFVLRNQELFV